MRRCVGRLGQAPIDDECFAEIAEHDVSGLDVAVNDAARMGKGDRLARRHESSEQVAKRERAFAGIAVWRSAL